MTTPAQRQRVWKATLALALYRAYGRVPDQAKIERNYQLACTHDRAMLGARDRQKQQSQSGQLVLF